MDAGVQHLAVLSTGEVWPNPRPLEKALRKIARWNRDLARRGLARLHARVRSIRQDALHKLTHQGSHTQHLADRLG